MKSSILDIYLCNHINSDDISLSKEYWENNSRTYEIFDELKKILAKNKRKLVDELFSTMGACECAQAEANYLQGFKMGMKIATEVLT